MDDLAKSGDEETTADLDRLLRISYCSELTVAHFSFRRMNSLDYTHLHEMRFSFSFRFTFQLKTSADRFWIWINHEPARSKDLHTPDSSSISFVRSNVSSTFFVRPQRLDQSYFFNVSGSLIPSFWISDIGSRMLIYIEKLVFPPRES